MAASSRTREESLPQPGGCAVAGASNTFLGATDTGNICHHRQLELTEAVSLGRGYVLLWGEHAHSGLATCFCVIIPSLLCEM